MNQCKKEYKNKTLKNNNESKKKKNIKTKYRSEDKMSFYNLCNKAYCSVADLVKKTLEVDMIGGEKLEAKIAVFALGGAASFSAAYLGMKTLRKTLDIADKKFPKLGLTKKKKENIVDYMIISAAVTAPFLSAGYIITQGYSPEANPLFISGVFGINAGLYAAIANDYKISTPAKQRKKALIKN